MSVLFCYVIGEVFNGTFFYLEGHASYVREDYMTWRLMRSMLLVLFLSIILLIAGGWVLDNIQYNSGYYDSFFRYRIRAFYDLPYWFLAVLALLTANGIWFIRLSALRGQGKFNPFSSGGMISYDIPIHPGMLLGGNLVLDCFLIVAFLFIKN